MVMVELAREIERSVQECLEDRVGVAFSGGLDSTTIAKVAKEFSKVELLSVGVAGSEDLVYAEMAAKELGLGLHKKVLSREEVVSYYGRAMEALRADFLKAEIMAPVYAVCEMAKEMGIEVVLFGSGAEELFVGYERYYTYWNEGKDLDEILRDEFETLKSRDIGMIKKVARKVGVEARFPFYNKRIADEVFGVPLAVRMEERELKKGLLREAAHFLGVPEAVVKRKKRALQYGSGVHKILLKEVGGATLLP
jgi:asparagine synthase (glutamine-hydrolysing)